MEYYSLETEYQPNKNYDSYQRQYTGMRNFGTLKPGISSQKMKYNNRKHAYHYREHQIQMENKALLAKITQNNSIANQFKTIFSVDRRLHNTSKKRKLYNEYERKLENLDLLKKIQNPKTNYSSKKMAKNYKQTQKYKNLVSKFPIQDEKQGKTIVNDQITIKNKYHKRYNKNSQKTEDRNYRWQRVPQVKNFRKFTNKSDEIQRSRYTNENYHGDKLQYRERIIRIYGTIQLLIDGKMYQVRGTHYTSHILLQIIMDDNEFRQIAIPYQQFVQNYEASFSILCQSIRYDDGLQQFYFI